MPQFKGFVISILPVCSTFRHTVLLVTILTQISSHSFVGYYFYTKFDTVLLVTILTQNSTQFCWLLF